MTDVAIRGLTKRFGAVAAVSDLTFDVPAGRITGFLGPNGAGKTTTLRMALDLIRPTAGHALIGGRRYRDLPHPRRVVGALLESTGLHPGRRGRDHLRVLATVAGASPARVAEVLDLVELTDAADRRVGGYSLGMRQRLGLAAALLGDPEVLVLDEPANGLDPAGMAWLRGLLRDQAARGRAVLVSSHLLSEVSQSVDDIVVISHGELRASGPLDRVLGEAEGGGTRVRAADRDALAAALEAAGIEFAPGDGGALLAGGTTPEAVGTAANEHHIALSELVSVGRSLEDVFFELTQQEEEEK